MAQNVTLNPANLSELRSIDPRLISYNIEMTEVTGGTFWKAFTPAQIAGEEEFSLLMNADDMNGLTDFMDMTKLMEVYPPLDMKNPALLALANGIGSAWIRVSGTWATHTYYDFDGHTGGKVPEGYRSVLTREQWTGVLDFVKATNSKLLISIANCTGAHKEDGTLDLAQAKLLFDFSRDYGVPIAAAEFMNEPNAPTLSGAPVGYTLEDYGRDSDLFFAFLRENYPDVLLVGPCGAGDAGSALLDPDFIKTAMPGGAKVYGTDEMLAPCTIKPDVFSYHFYNGISERGAFMGGHWDPARAHTEEYLAEPGRACKVYIPMRDRLTPGAQMWVTESADAASGGNTWGSTYLDVLRYANELGSFAQLTDGVIFHNTFCSSDYGLLDSKTHEPRPNYWLAYLWNQLMGTTVYDTKEEVHEGMHLFAHSRKDGKEGTAYLLINNSLTDVTTVTLPSAAARYTLSAPALRSREILLNGAPMTYDTKNGFSAVTPVMEEAGTVTLAPATVTFFVV